MESYCLLGQRLILQVVAPGGVPVVSDHDWAEELDSLWSPLFCKGSSEKCFLGLGCQQRPEPPTPGVFP